MAETPVVVFSGKHTHRPHWIGPLTEAMAAEGLDLELHMDPAEVAPERVDYLLITANGPVRDFAPYTRLRAMLGLWAGVEGMLKLDLPADVPFARMVEPGLTEGMVDYVVGHVLRHHLDIDRYIGADPIAEWEVSFPPLARNRRVAILGLGELGTACAAALAALNFRVTGWSRSPKQIPGVATRHGPEALPGVLEAAEILVLLLPHTPDTLRVIDAAALARMPAGACIVNAGRGPLIDHAALLAALDSGQIRHATMDVFDVEPLPPGHPYWAHPRVTVTPHIASVTRPETASRALMQNIARDLAGKPLLGVVDRGRGY
ncbi:glyoxylate/hydroxypyruvate reductase A [Paralimibaculum aggregatum]|uniref:Glyoxylate/hydroxypyruvate reductase A n=1 Tax=Paralimibaculum aggregatum TaxID=3036245 RepID=A0ABQ6LQA8_9RHOB|nr:glyoxylate/hydroxypyruvate reductase A [Limibaculum sp. NKW23]GMG84112.1 glyoxylate/hydroxypyruvate reductase A [Limibaculum sp. NKW23]